MQIQIVFQTGWRKTFFKNMKKKAKERDSEFTTFLYFVVMKEAALCKIVWEKLRNQAKLDINAKLWCLPFCIFWEPAPKNWFL